MFAALVFLMLNQQPSQEDYTSVIEIYSKYADRLNDPKYWSRVRVIGPDGKEKGYDDMDIAERRTLVMLFAQKMTVDGQRVQDSWSKPEDQNGKQKLPAEQVKAYCAKLLDQRKKFAREYEKFLHDNQKHLGTLVNQYEIDDLIRSARKTHQAMKLSEGK